MKVVENRVLREISGCKRKQVTGGWRKLHNGVMWNVGRGGEYGGKQKCMQSFGGQTWRKQTTSRPEAQM